MNFDEYFAKRSDLTMRVLADIPESVEVPMEGRLVGIGAGCLVAAVALQIWAAHALVDPGYFARTSTFLGFVLLAGVSILVASKASSAWLAQTKARLREGLKERTLERLISADRTIALRLAHQKR